MGPVTRSRRSAKASSSKATPNDEIRDKSPGSSTEVVDQLPSESMTLESLLTRALGGAKELERENNTLRTKVELLESRLDQVKQTDGVPPQSQPKRSIRAAATSIRLKSEVNQLKKQVKRLEKLLRKFHDLMLENSLDDNEECLICYETLLPKKCRSLPCQHTFCDGCVSKIIPEPDDNESIRCPQCRGLCSRDDADLVEFTASEQWDALLDVARQWAKMDVRRVDDTTEEEDAEDFIDDGTEESSTAGSESGPAKPPESSPEPSVEQRRGVSTTPLTPSRLRKRRAVMSPTAGTPEPEEDGEAAIPEARTTTQEPNEENGLEGTSSPFTTPTASTSTQPAPSYSQSQPKDKRKMLEQLAEARSKKPRY
ncbi:hypothetical protein C8Q78DRAFT_1073954 [Trametes maxima]|nr:hypothetical protein C8Q78DRAFT_1073954 [Trametes maxima]